ncbi:MAG: hypothetical protein ACO259_10815 [Bacteroidia bacterium]
MGSTKKIFYDIRNEKTSKEYYDLEWENKVLYTKDKLKKSSLKNGDGFGFDSQRLNSK